MGNQVKLKIPLQYDFKIVGIVSSEPIYRLAWLLNETLGLELSEDSKLKLYHAKRELLQDFEYFRDNNSEEDTYELIHNKGVNGLLLEEQSKVDYLVKFSQSKSNIDFILQKIKSIKGVTMVFEIDPKNLKSINRLLFDVIDD